MKPRIPTREEKKQNDEQKPESSIKKPVMKPRIPGIKKEEGKSPSSDQEENKDKNKPSKPVIKPRKKNE